MDPLFHRLAAPVINIENTETKMFDRSFRAHFGMSVAVCRQIWLLLEESDCLPEKCVATFLLWALYFLKTYNTEDVASARFNCTPKTYRKWVWKVLHCIYNLNLVN